ncbi:hypothetical protein [Salinigranum halophilum]|uniref:hypothetical protein n=1 Tax=Salinigranum halophilum TaxID=2565931 RepID=UPI0010A85262|nr:hypothetical protein [Salinigranum halophilum]
MKAKPLDTVLVVDRQRMTEAELPAITEAATNLTAITRPHHIQRYSTYGHQLQVTAGIEVESVPRIALDISQAAGRTIINPAVDYALRHAIVGEVDWQEIGPDLVSAVAAVDQDAVNNMVAQVLGMADWEDLDLNTAGNPLPEFGAVQDRHRELQNSLGWTPPRRAIPDARRALETDIDLREVVLGPTSGFVVWEAEELIEMDLAFLKALGAGVPTVGVYLENGSLRRPYSEIHSLRHALESQGTEFVYYEDIDASSTQKTLDAERDTSPQVDFSREHTDEQRTSFGGEHR